MKQKSGDISAYEFYKNLKRKDGGIDKQKQLKQKKKLIEEVTQSENLRLKKRAPVEVEVNQPTSKKAKKVPLEASEERERKSPHKEMVANKGDDKSQQVKQKKKHVEEVTQSENVRLKKRAPVEVEINQSTPKKARRVSFGPVETSEEHERKSPHKEMGTEKGDGNSQTDQKLSKGQRKRLKKQQKKREEALAQSVPAKSPLRSQLESLLEKKREFIQESKKASTSQQLAVPENEEESDVESEDEKERDVASSEGGDALPEPLNPYVEGENILKEMLYPFSIEEFFKNHWEKKILHVERNNPDYYTSWLSTADFDEMLRENRVMFTEHLDVTSYKDGVRSTLNPEGRAFPAIVWDYFRTGCSVRMLCPQTFVDQLAFNLNVLQEYFGCFVGANTYLTPPGMQGFAPHYDDIEAFVLQLEGSKKWRIYNPRNASEKMPRFSSGNFKPNEVGQPIMEVTVRAGDMLYFPRGMIHQAVCPDDDYSFHLTVSTNQKNTWGDLLLKLLPAAVEQAMASSTAFRNGLPPGFLRYMGTCVNESRLQPRARNKREEMMNHVKMLATSIIDKYLPVDRACDELGKQLANDSLPPILEENEAAHHVSQQGERWSERAQGVVNAVEISPDTELRLVRFTGVRCVRSSASKRSKKKESDEEVPVAQLYHSLCNTRVYREVEPIFSSVSAEALPCIEKLIAAFPSFVRVENFPLTDLDEKLSVASSLYEMGLVVTRQPLDTIEDDPSDSE